MTAFDISGTKPARMLESDRLSAGRNPEALDKAAVSADRAGVVRTQQCGLADFL